MTAAKGEDATGVKAAYQRGAKVDVRSFNADWSEVAKADTTGRDHLIQIGLAKRIVRKKNDDASFGGGGK